jgi:hypothetical protein
VNGTRFDNGAPLWPSSGNPIGAFQASGSAKVRVGLGRILASHCRSSTPHQIYK